MMKYIIVFLIAIATTYALSDMEEWIKFKRNYSKVYRNPVEEKIRFSIFQKNLRRIEEHNEKYVKGVSTFKMGLNHLGDATGAEFLNMLNNQKKTLPTFPRKSDNIEYMGDVPDEVDWRKEGAVTEVKDQKGCISYWAIDATGALEGAFFLKTGRLVSMSDQNLVDCAHDDCFGCKGGKIDKALEYIKENGIMAEGAYPYEAVVGDCRFNASASIVKVKQHKYVKKNDEEDLKKAVARQPVAVAINATLMFQFYQEGLFTDEYCSNKMEDLHHGGLVVGYGKTQLGTDYWLVKNSWSITWGMNGYIMMRRNENNQCGIATNAVYPVL